MRADMPGVDPKNIQVNVTGDMLTVRGNREEKKETKKRDFLRREVRYGSYEYSTSLPEGVKADNVKASYRDGVLELTATMPKELAPKEVKVRVESSFCAQISPAATVFARRVEVDLSDLDSGDGRHDRSICEDSAHSGSLTFCARASRISCRCVPTHQG